MSQQINRLGVLRLPRNRLCCEQRIQDRLRGEQLKLKLRAGRFGPQSNVLFPGRRSYKNRVLGWCWTVNGTLGPLLNMVPSVAGVLPSYPMQRREALCKKIHGDDPLIDTSSRTVYGVVSHSVWEVKPPTSSSKSCRLGRPKT
jgi:hypothetical protein